MLIYYNIKNLSYAFIQIKTNTIYNIIIFQKYNYIFSLKNKINNSITINIYI